jgi:hypothetical protein
MLLFHYFKSCKLMHVIDDVIVQYTIMHTHICFVVQLEHSSPQVLFFLFLLCIKEFYYNDRKGLLPLIPIDTSMTQQLQTTTRRK